MITNSDSDDDGSGGKGTGATGASTSDGGTGGVGGSADGGAGGGATCDDSVGTSADCSLATTSCTEGNGALLEAVTLCNVSDDYFKPGVAQSATECIVALDTSATCDDVLTCRDNALSNACEADVSIECASLVQSCAGGVGAIDQLECEALLPGFSEAGVAAVVAQCGPPAEGCLLGGFYEDLLDCVDNLVPAQ